MARATRFPSRADAVSERIAGFTAHLRHNGVRAGMAETETAMRALGAIDPLDPHAVRTALRAVCASDQDEQSRFDLLFDSYWFADGRIRQRNAPNRQKPSPTTRATPPSPLQPETAEQSGGTRDRPDDSSDDGESERSGDGRLIGSKTTSLKRTDLRHLVTPEDFAEAEAVAERIARAIVDRRSRRRRAARRGATIDFRRVVRHSIARGGEPIELFRRRRPDRPVHITALLDVSGSMSVYARVFLAFLKGLVGADLRTDAYLFHTRLVRISDALRDHETSRAVDRLSLMAQGFGGGTKIGANLQAFHERYGQGLGSRSVVIILSDGYDTDPPDIIDDALARLKRRGCRIVWLNPLLGWRGYEPVARSMAAALPHLDLFAPANTLEALGRLEPQFADL